MSTIMKMPASDHYLPIVDGWRRCDHFLNELESRTGRHSELGYTLAAAYLVEMTAEHFRQWGRKEAIYGIISKHPHYSFAQHPQKENYTDQCYRQNRLLFEHPVLFEMKYRFAGIAMWIAKKLVSIPFVFRIREKYKYPFTLPIFEC